MESITKFVSSWSYSRESAASRTAGVYGNPRLAAGLLLGYFLLGLIIVIVAFCTQHKRLRVLSRSIILILTCQYSSLKGVQNIHDSMLTLLFMDIINSVTAVVHAVYLISLTCDYACSIVYYVWFLSKFFGIVLHLLCALISVLHLCHPHWRVQLQSLGAVVVVLTIPFIVLYFYFPLAWFIGFAVITFGLAQAIIAQSSGSTASPSAAASKRWIIFVAMFTFLVIYLPTFVLHCLIISPIDPSQVENYDIIYANLVYCTNIQLVMDGILCFLILRLPAEVEKEQQPLPYRCYGNNHQHTGQHGIEIPRVTTIQNPYFN